MRCLLAYGGVLLSAPISHGRRADGLRDLPANRCNELKGPGVGMDSPIDIRRAPSTPGLNGVDDRRGPARGSHHGTEPPWLPGPDSGGRRAAGATTPGVDLTREPCPSSRRDLEPSAGHPDDDSAQVRATAFLLMLMLMLIDAGAQSSQPFGLEPFSLARAQCPAARAWSVAFWRFRPY